MSELRNRVGQLAVVVPFEGADEDIQVHGGKIVKPVRFGASGLGGNSWKTEPELFDGFGNVIGWDDMDLKPLGGPEHLQAGPMVAASEVIGFDIIGESYPLVEGYRKLTH